MKNIIQTSNALPRPAWRRLHWLNTALLAFALATPLLAESSQDQDEDKQGKEYHRPHIVRPDSRPFGQTYPEWAAQWWQWVLTIPADGHHPLQDETGADAARGQSGPVWFLGGVINVSGTAVRYVTVPSGKALFFPVGNVECSTVEPPPFYGANEAELRACAEGFPPGTMACTIDGRPVGNLTDFESTSPLFDFSLPANNILGIAGGGSGQGVDHGTYLMVKGLSPGEHTIAFRASSADGGFTLNVTYHLTVEHAAHVFPPKSHPYGKTYGEWAANWWLWAMSMPLDGHHPLQDETGADAARGQSGNVWFLCGVWNATGVAERHITVPSGRALFVALGNTECSTLEGAPFHGDNEAELRACAQGFRKNAAFCEIDGRPVADLDSFHPTSPLFDFTVGESNVLGTPAGSGQAVDDGLYVMVPPLKVGDHTIRFTCTLADFPATFSITYHVTVTPRHH